MNKKINIISIDLGTKNLIVRVNQETIFDQPSAIVFDNETGQVYIGQEALKMRNKIPHSKTFIEPLANGVISDVNALIALLTEIFINILQLNNNKVWKKAKFWKNSIVLVGVPSKIYLIDEEALKEALQGRHVPRIPIFSEKFRRYQIFSNVLQAKNVKMIPEVKLAAIGAGASIWDANGVFILDIGGGTSDCAIISAGDIILQDSIKFGGNNIDYEIKKYLAETHYISVPIEEAEQAKITVGVAVTTEKIDDKDNNIMFYGKDNTTGRPEKIAIARSEINNVIIQSIEPIIELCKKVMFYSTESFAKTIRENGLILTGGGALLTNLDTYLKERLDIEIVSVAAMPEKCVIKGAEIYEMHKHDFFEKGYIRPSR